MASSGLNVYLDCKVYNVDKASALPYVQYHVSVLLHTALRRFLPDRCGAATGNLMDGATVDP